MEKPINKDLIIAEIKKYNASEIEKVANFIREKSNFFSIVTELEDTYTCIIQEFNNNKRGQYAYSIFNHIYIYFINSKYIFFLYLRKNHLVLFKNMRKIYKAL
jgi:hypothetical protein